MRRTRKGGPRRTAHPMPDLTRVSIEEFLAEERGEGVRFGVQAELCRSTMCCVCWVLYLARQPGVNLRFDHGHGERSIDWRLLPGGQPRGASIAHHEPEGIHGDDDDTIPLCIAHHTGPSFKARHPGSAASFWEQWGIRWEQVRDEMRRRVKEQRR